MPLLPFARAARDAGHDVVLAGPAPIAAVAASAGLDYAELARPDEEPLAAARRRVAELDGVEQVRAAIGDLFVTTYGGAALSSTLALVERWRPHMIAHETAEASAPIAGQFHRVPTVRVSVALATRSEAWWLGLAGPALDGLRARAGLAADPGAEGLSRTPLLTRAPSALDVGEGDPPPDVRRFRHEDDGDAAALGAWWPGLAPETPLVPISFGTVIPLDGHFPGVYRNAIDAVADLPVRILVTVGPNAEPAALGALPPNVHVERWVPIAAVLRDAVALVTHGGTGTTLAALAAGVPMALTPISADQPRNAWLVAELGAAVALESGPADAVRLGDAVRTLLGDDRYARAAQRIAAEIRELEPVAAAIEQLEDLAAGSPGVRPAE
jgi:UDP:flavonoid glycosyltransferase YjiC (YdhE family)